MMKERTWCAEKVAMSGSQSRPRDGPGERELGWKSGGAELEAQASGLRGGGFAASILWPRPRIFARYGGVSPSSDRMASGTQPWRQLIGEFVAGYSHVRWAPADVDCPGGAERLALALSGSQASLQDLKSRIAVALLSVGVPEWMMRRAASSLSRQTVRLVANRAIKCADAGSCPGQRALDLSVVHFCGVSQGYLAAGNLWCPTVHAEPGTGQSVAVVCLFVCLLFNARVSGPVATLP